MGTFSNFRSSLRGNSIPAILGLTLLFSLSIGACQAPEQASPAPEESAAVQSVAVEADTEQSAEASGPEPTREVDHCLDCHTDEERLKAVANPVVVLESESSGEG